MHELMQQLETLHSAHDLDHLGAPGDFWDPRTYTKAGKAQIAADVEMRNTFDEEWTKVVNKKDVLIKFVSSKLTTDNKIVIDSFLSKDKKENNDFEAHKTALKVVIDNADDAEIQRMVEAFWKNSSTRILLNEWVKSKQYNK
jgi:hypothetical protein